jgi:hypothetical protein
VLSRLYQLPSNTIAAVVVVVVNSKQRVELDG